MSKIAIILASAATLLVSVAMVQAANWKEEHSVDRLTGDKSVRMTIVGRGAIRQFGRSLSSHLALTCVHPNDGSAAYLSVYLILSEKVSVADARTRYRFDGGPVHTETIGVSRRGNYFSLSNTFLSELQNSTKLRMEINLPWAGDPIIEFDTVGSKAIVDYLPCRPIT